MVDSLRKALYCLLLIALPLQAFASGGIQHCASMQIPLSQLTGMSAALKGGAAGLSQQDGRNGVSAAVTGCDDRAQGSQSSDGSAGHCASMAGCGVAAASVPAHPLFMRMLAGGALSVLHLSPHIRFLTGAPERPPRITA